MWDLEIRRVYEESEEVLREGEREVGRPLKRVARAAVSATSTAASTLIASPRSLVQEPISALPQSQVPCGFFRLLEEIHKVATRSSSMREARRCVRRPSASIGPAIASAARPEAVGPGAHRESDPETKRSSAGPPGSRSRVCCSRGRKP